MSAISPKTPLSFHEPVNNPLSAPKSPSTLRILHTADWHLGKKLNHENRYEEFGEFLAWLIDCIKINSVDIVVVAGDIFDTMTPSNKAQELYYHFLGQLSTTGCRHAVIVAGNHDSPSFLDAPKTLFRHFNIYVVGTACQDLSDEMLVLNDKNDNPDLIVAAIPYLRERDIRTSEFGDSLEKKQKDALDGIKAHYQSLLQLCKTKQNQILNEHGKTVPLLATGHLFATGASVAAEKDGMRELYVGTLGQVGAEIFDGYDYVALGHIHREQMVSKQSHIRYSGSPMAFCFDEENQAKKVLLVDFDANNNLTPAITPIIIPTFRVLKTLKGAFSDIKTQLTDLKNTLSLPQSDNIFVKPKTIWLNIECHTNTPIYNFKEQLEDLIKDLPIALLQIKQWDNHQKQNTPKNRIHKSLQELTPKEVFLQLLEDYHFIETNTSQESPSNISNQENLIALYNDILYQLDNEDRMAI